MWDFMYIYLKYHHGSKLFPPQPMLQRKKGLLIFFNRKRLRELLNFLLVASDLHFFSINNCCSVTLSGLTLCSPMDCSTLGLTVPHHLLKFAQVHVPCISDAIQPSHPLMPPSPSALDLSQHQGLFQWVSCSHQMTKILELLLYHQPFWWVFGIDFP